MFNQKNYGNATLENLANYFDKDIENEYIISSQKDSIDEIIDFSDIDEMYVIYKKYQFKIEDNLKITLIREVTSDLEEEATKVLAYKVKNNNGAELECIKNSLNDLSGNGNDAILYNTTLTENRDGIVFNESYAQLELNQDLTFPLTFEFDIQTSTQKKNSVIFIEPKSKTAFGTWDNYFCCSITTETKTIPMPSDFFDGNLKHIVLEYTSLNEFELYIDGVKLTKNNNLTDAWRAGIGSVPRIGSRVGADYFKGTLYTFRIYNRILEEDEILSMNNNNTNLLLEYNVKNDTEYNYLPKTINDLSKNNNNGKCYNLIYNNVKNGLIFNGTSSYVDFDLQQNLTFPITFEIDIATSTKMNSVIFIEPKSKTALGTWENYFCCSIFDATKTIPIPSDFFDGTLKHVVLEYNSLYDFEMYINGTKLLKNNSLDSWSNSIGSVPRIGSRVGSNFFNGVLYEFNIYDGILTENNILNNYNKAKGLYQ